jgi:hypothetical protein
VLGITEQPEEDLREKFAVHWADLAGWVRSCRAACSIIPLIFKDIRRGTAFAYSSWHHATSLFNEVVRYSFAYLK